MLRLILSTWALCGLALASEPAGGNATPEQIVADLLAGNSRYVAHQAKHPHQDVARRTELAKGQHPPAIILGCADSRVSPELLFDQGLGDLFVVRVAGNIVNDDVLGSLEYAVEHLGSRVIVVLGHQRCGAVAATVEGGHAEGHVASLLHAIQPAVDATRNAVGDRVENAIRANVTRVRRQIEAAPPILSKALREGKLRVIGAEYMLDSGRVEILK